MSDPVHTADLKSIDDKRVGDRVEVALPARPEFFLVARMTASAVAARYEFGVADIDDLRLAIDELCNLCIAGASESSKLTLSYDGGSDHIDVLCTVTSVSESKTEVIEADSGDFLLPDRSQLSETILSALADEYKIDRVDQGVRRAFLRKVRSRTGN